MTAQTQKPLKARLVARRRKVGRWLRSPAFKRLTHHTLPLFTIFGVCAFISYGHVEAYALMNGETETVAALMPVLYDALMFGSIPYMNARHFAARYAAFAGFGYGFTMSLVANIKASAPTFDGKLIGVSVAVVLGLTAIMVHFGSKPAPRWWTARRVARKAAAARKPAGKVVELDTKAVPAPGARNTPPGLVATAEPVWRG